MSDNPQDRFLPRQVVIEHFGNGGFRFPGYSHLGSLLVLPSGMRAWRPVHFGEVVPDDFRLTIAEANTIDVLMIGSGSTMLRLPATLATHLTAAGLRFDVMSTSAAIHTYNVMLAENRRVAAAMIAVDKAHDRS